jgi:hypothetical protein
MFKDETDTQVRLRRAKESLLIAREAENTARIALADAVRTTARAKERYEELFMQEGREEVQRRKHDYCHATK